MTLFDSYSAPLFVTESKTMRNEIALVYKKRYPSSRIYFMTCQELVDLWLDDHTQLNQHDAIFHLCGTVEHRQDIQDIERDISIWNGPFF